MSEVWQDGTSYLDPSLEEEDLVANSIAQQSKPTAAGQLGNNTTESAKTDRSGTLTLALMPLYANGQVALMVQSGTITADELLDKMEEAFTACRKVYAIVKQVSLSNSNNMP